MIDWDRVAVLRDEVGAEEFQEIVDLFLSEVETAIEDLCEAQDDSRLAEQMHFIKGSAMTLGFAKVSELATQGEADADAEQPLRVGPATLKKQFLVSRQAFLTGLPKVLAA